MKNNRKNNGKNKEKSIALGVKLNLTNIDKKVLFKGDKGIYLDCKVYVNKEKDEFGNRVKITHKNSLGNTIYIGNGIVFDDGEQCDELSLALRVNLKKIEKDSIYEGKNYDYLDCYIYVNEEEDEFGHSVKMTYVNSAEETVYIGNGKKVSASISKPIQDDDLPF